MVTVEAVGCQKAIAEQVAEKQAWYVVAVKENHPELYNQIGEYFRWVEEEEVGDEFVDVWKRGVRRIMGGYIWGHWSIENELHWVLEVVFGEDRDRKRKDHAPENLNVVRKEVITLLRGGSQRKRQATSA
jgi:predicted transposase YbfD/YdcC